ncbi:MAG TPA: hypothetical protein VHD36_08520 [Pirellulales bacterium]|nr:hypothetical protein [Pirellulales bacterium]
MRPGTAAAPEHPIIRFPPQAATNRQLTAHDLPVDKLRTLLPADRRRAPGNPLQNSSGNSQFVQLALLQSIDESLRRLRQLAEAGRQLPATFTPPEY